MTPTAKQLDTLRYIVAFFDANGYPAPMRHIAKYHGISVPAVYDRVYRLRVLGLLDSSALRSTHATPTQAGRSMCEPRCCPKCGANIAA